MSAEGPFSGGPEALGRSHARAAGERLRGFSIPFVRQSEKLFGTSLGTIRAHAVDLARAVPAEYQAEMRALARTAGVADEDILALNTFLDADCLCEAGTVYCLNAVGFGGAVANTSLLHGRNLDFPAGGYAEKMAAVFEFRPDKGYRFLSIGFAGIIGVLTGMNECGLTIAEITSRTRKVSAKGMPLMILLRQVLQYAGTIEEAVEIIRSAPRTGGFNVTITDWRVPEAVCVEFDAEQVAVRRAERGLLVSSENRLTKELGKGQRLSPSGVARHIRACDLLEQHYGRLTPEIMIEILRDKWDPIHRRQGTSPNCICNANTVQSVVFIPEERRALVSNRHLPAPEGEYVEYRLEG